MYNDNPPAPTTYRDISTVIIANNSDDSSSSTSTLDPIHDLPPEVPDELNTYM